MLTQLQQRLNSVLPNGGVVLANGFGGDTSKEDIDAVLTYADGLMAEHWTAFEGVNKVDGTLYK